MGEVHGGDDNWYFQSENKKVNTYMIKTLLYGYLN